MFNQPSVKPQTPTDADQSNRLATACWTMVAFLYFLLAAYFVWFSVDTDLTQAAIWFSLGVCFFCVGLVPVSVPDRNVKDTNSASEMSSDRKD